MSTRRERIEARLAKRREWAESRETKSEAAFSRARTLTDGIPLGQPILVGHHSEARHRRVLEKSDNAMRAGCESLEMAKHHESKAAGLADQLERSIFSDDPDAVEALEAKAQALEQKRDRLKAVNAAYRKAPGADPAAKLTSMCEAGTITREEALGIARFWALCPYHAGTCHPSYELTNIGATIRAARKRIELVKARAEAEAKTEAAGGLLIERGEHGYCAVRFSEYPGRATVDALKAAGFYWSGGCWSGKTESIPATVIEQEKEQQTP